MIVKLPAKKFYLDRPLQKYDPLVNNGDSTRKQISENFKTQTQDELLRRYSGRTKRSHF
jgi:hypothetical protein